LELIRFYVGFGLLNYLYSQRFLVRVVSQTIRACDRASLKGNLHAWLLLWNAATPMHAAWGISR